MAVVKGLGERLGPFLLSLAVVAAAVIVSSRAWVLARAEWEPVMGTAIHVDSSLVRGGGVQQPRSFSADCAGPSLATMPWRLGPRLTFHVGMGADVALVEASHRTERILDRAVAAFGHRDGPCGRGPFDRWAEVGERTELSTGVIVTSGGARCGVPDGISVVEWGELPGPRLGLTCVVSQPDQAAVLRVVEADIRLDIAERWVLGAGPCRAAYDVQAILTHELGHVVGLQHPREERAYSGSTMSWAAPVCDQSGRTLSGQDLVSLATLVP